MTHPTPTVVAAELRAKANDAENWADSFTPKEEYRQHGWLTGFAETMRRAATLLEQRGAVIDDAAVKRANDIYDSQGMRAALTAALSNSPVGMEEPPVAWEYELATGMQGNEYTNWRYYVTTGKPDVAENAIRNLRPLYAARSALPPPTQWTEERLREVLAEECRKQGFGYAEAVLANPERYGESHWCNVALSALRRVAGTDQG